ncbi:hypothetical protein AYL99_03497 [Fonsecaea erecta]|uniref:Bacteriophage T5 Orf172 DNA-binding domain-containing protein n=1 Tax=Fonsecaea erecta TaxID=1367422 RepID=A0A178ZPJ1_9EURO|nr:hypothetical protein AYL99_03497 [Fonsecaea erecta]OAP61296.1 hypothetical protein AYL99_03497 [Fonsecaea erecta]
MVLNPGVAWFISFSDHDPSINKKCIFFTKKANNPRCGSECEREDNYRAIQLYQIINAPSKNAVGLDVLQEYVLCNCCKFARHQDRIGNLDLLIPLAQRWQDEIQRNLDQAVTGLDEIPSQSVGGQLQYNLRSREVETSVNSAQYQVTTISQPPLSEFQVHIKEPGLGDSVSCKLVECLKGGDERDFETGSLYIYHRDSSPGYVKIGWTANSVWDRLQRWEEKCGYSAHILMSVHEIPNAHRVETLTHHELIKNWRRERKCQKEDCQISHQEWFEISKEQAMLVLTNWAMFMSAAKPYNTQGELKDVWKKAVAKMDGNGEAITAQKMSKLHSELLTEEKQSAPPPINTEYSSLDISMSSQANSSTPPSRAHPPKDFSEQIVAIRQGIEELKLLMRDNLPRKDAKRVSDEAGSPATENEPIWKEEEVTLLDDQLAGLSLEKEVVTTLDVVVEKANAMTTAIETLPTAVPLGTEVVTMQA